MADRRVVITGMGTINPLGNNCQQYWQALLEGRSGIDRISLFDPTDYPCQIAGEVKGFDPAQHFDVKQARRLARFIQFALVASREAVADAGLDIGQNPEQVGVEIGSGIGGIDVMQASVIDLHTKGPKKVSPFTVPMMIAGMASGMVAIEQGAKGHNAAATTACASANNSIINAYQCIRNGQAEAMISGGAEAAITPLAMAAFASAKALSLNNQHPQQASRPFDLNRDGFVMGEGAGIVILESLEHAKQRGASIYAEIVGYGATGDAYHMTSPAPDGDGAARAMKQALAMAGIRPDQIDHINAHGTSTPQGDAIETAAINTVFTDSAKDLIVNSTKSMTGHLLGAAGGIELIATVLAMKNATIPPTINLDHPDERCDLNYNAKGPVSQPVEYALSNSFGFGGHNAVLAIKRVMSESL